MAAPAYPCRRLLGLGLLLVLLLSGCSRRPSAPALEDEPVYRNTQEGFRLLAPEGWTIRARAALPAGKLEREHLLVRYERTDPRHAAFFEVTAVDLDPAVSLEGYLAGPSYGVQRWQPQGSPQPVEIADVSGQRFDFAGTIDRHRMLKEVVAVRKGPRVYFFSAVFQAGDTASRDQIRDAVASLLWSK